MRTESFKQSRRTSGGACHGSAVRSTCTALLCAALMSTSGLAAAGERSAKRGATETYMGIVHMVPRGGVGTWQIGSRTFQTDSFTEVDAYRYKAAPGSCALVVQRSSRVTQIVMQAPSAC
jgi:hypothetical protein